MRGWLWGDLRLAAVLDLSCPPAPTWGPAHAHAHAPARTPHSSIFRPHSCRGSLPSLGPGFVWR